MAVPRAKVDQGSGGPALSVQEAPGNIVHPSAINLPAQTFYQTLPVIYEVLHR